MCIRIIDFLKQPSAPNLTSCAHNNATTTNNNATSANTYKNNETNNKETSVLKAFLF